MRSAGKQPGRPFTGVVLTPYNIHLVFVGAMRMQNVGKDKKKENGDPDTMSRENERNRTGSVRPEGTEEIKNQRSVFQMLAEFEDNIALLHVNKIIESALDFISHRLDIDRLSIALLETEKGGFNLLAVRHDMDTVPKGHFLPFENTILTEIIKQKEPVYRPDIRTQKREYEVDIKLTAARIYSDIMIPLIREGKCIGTLNAASKGVDGISGEDRMVLTLLAPHLAQSIKNAQLFEEIEHLKEQLELENEYLREELNEVQAFGDIIGHSAALRNVLKQIEVVSPTDASVLIYGESGTGKELVAREIHRNSTRKEHTMIKVNCATIPRELYESEFFGHVKGAFTGATRDRAGRFEAADGGTLFLDEVGEIPYDLQSKLLRVLQEGEYERVGEEKTRSVDVRIIAATNKDLKQAVEKRRFREDLYYRLNVFPIEIAPLHQRKEDIPPLASHLLNIAKTKFNNPGIRMTRANLFQLQKYDWPGNVREMQNIIERAVITSQKNVLRFDLPSSSRTSSSEQVVRGSEVETDQKIFTEGEMRSQEKENIRAALRQCNGKVYGPKGAAELLGVPPTTLMGRMKRMGIKKSF
jgi:transcriptional regulator with GAF, ATPase, and Fis domain